MRKSVSVSLGLSLLFMIPSGCFEDSNTDSADTDPTTDTGGDGDGDPTGDGDGDPTGDGDGDPTGDGDGDPTGDGDGDPTGDGDGDPTGDGDGDPTGDGDGDPTGDGDGDPTGDGDGDPEPDPCDECVENAYGVGGACHQQYEACQASPDCSDVFDCVENCDGDMACGNLCYNGGTPEAQQLYLVLIACIVGPDAMSGACGQVCS